MLVGNDVVDLRDPDTGSDAIHPRFDIRVFTEDERRWIAEALRPVRLRWTLWAAKESAFKVAVKLQPGTRFHPRRFAVRLMENAGVTRAEVIHHLAGRFDVWIEEARDWVHAVARPADEEESAPLSALSFLEAASRDASAAGRRVRELAMKAVAPLIPAEGDELSIVMEDGIPRLRRDGAPLPVDLSLSHHGRLVACAWSDPRS